jgi:N utilization substance protein A
MDILHELNQIAAERDIPIEELQAELETALAVAYKKYKGATGEVSLTLDLSGKGGKGVRAFIEKEVVGEVLEPSFQIGLPAARKRREDVEIGDFIPVEVDPIQFGRIAAQTFKQVLAQKMREAELRQIHDQFSERIGEIVSGTVTRREDSNVLLQVNRTEVKLPKREQVGTEDYRPNERFKLYVLKIEETYRGFEVIVSRSHPNLVRKLLDLEVPEISEGVVEIVSVAREPGQRTKLAVRSHDERIDAVGACVGQRGGRIQALMDELRPEKIDVVPYSEEAREFITHALSPAKVNSMKLDEEQRSAYVVVPDSQLSLAIGRGGQNVRLAARLSEWKIDIRGEAQAAEEAAEKGEAPAEEAAPAEAAPAAVPEPAAEAAPAAEGAAAPSGEDASATS